MKKQLAFIFLVLLCSMQSIAASYDAWWQQGNGFYQQKQYDSAAAYFEKIAALKPKDAVVYYNLGNTYYRLNKIGPAVLNYERALKINPYYKEAKDNLILTRNRIQQNIQNNSVIFFIRWWRMLTEQGKATTWSVVSAVLFVALFVILIFRRLGKGGVRIRPQLLAISFVVWGLTFLFSFVSSCNKIESIGCVVMGSDVPLMATQQTTGKPQVFVPEGTVVELKDKENGWAEVRLPDGRTGWIQENMITGI